MPELDSIADIALVAAFLLPGMIILLFRSRFTTGKLPPASEAVLPYLACTIFYIGVFGWCFDEALRRWPQTHGAIILVFTFILPALIGIVLGLDAQRSWSRGFFAKFGVMSVHPVGSAWDWKFGTMSEQFVLVTLKDGTQYGGRCATGSFASSESGERDLYIEELWNVVEDGEWTQRASESVLIMGGEIRTIEFRS